MSLLLYAALSISLASAFAAIVLGRNLTRSVVAGYAMVSALALALLLARAGFLALVVVTVGALVLATIQLFGWMLVDVDRDHLPPTDAPTWLARGLAFLVFGVALVLMLYSLALRGELGIGQAIALAEPVEIGRYLFGSMREVTALLGFTIAGALLASILLLRDDGREG